MSLARDLGLSMLQRFSDDLAGDDARWGPLLEFRNGLEGWWKGELASSLIRWTNDQDEYFCVALEQQTDGPGWREGGTNTGRCDVLVYSYDNDDPAPYREKRGGPRVWFELKQRATWWPATKAFGVANHGIHHDLQKWRETRWADTEAAFAVLFLGHDSEDLNEHWNKAIHAVGEPMLHHAHRHLVDDQTQRWLHLVVWDLRT